MTNESSTNTFQLLLSQTHVTRICGFRIEGNMLPAPGAEGLLQQGPFVHQLFLLWLWSQLGLSCLRSLFIKVHRAMAAAPHRLPCPAHLRRAGLGGWHLWLCVKLHSVFLSKDSTIDTPGQSLKSAPTHSELKMRIWKCSEHTFIKVYLPHYT